MKVSGGGLISTSGAATVVGGTDVTGSLSVISAAASSALDLTSIAGYSGAAISARVAAGAVTSTALAVSKGATPLFTVKQLWLPCSVS